MKKVPPVSQQELQGICPIETSRLNPIRSRATAWLGGIDVAVGILLYGILWGAPSGVVVCVSISPQFACLWMLITTDVRYFPSPILPALPLAVGLGLLFGWRRWRCWASLLYHTLWVLSSGFIVVSTVMGLIMMNEDIAENLYVVSAASGLAVAMITWLLALQSVRTKPRPLPAEPELEVGPDWDERKGPTP